MTPEEVKSIAREAGKAAVTDMLSALGIDTSPDHLQKAQADFLWLRKTRENSENFHKVAYVAVFIGMVGFFGAMLWDAGAMLVKSIVIDWASK